MIKFFTYDYNNYKSYLWPFLILRLEKYLKRSETNLQQYEEILVDPGVDDLTKGKFYKWEKNNYQETLKFVIELLDSLLENHYFSWDYPSDMNPKYTDFFKERSWSNAIHLCWHPQFIVTVQYKFNDLDDFKRMFDKYNSLSIAGFMGLGNICKQKGLSTFIKYAIPYAFKRAKVKRIHIYGLNKRSMRYANRMAQMFDIDLSVDNRKWEYYKPSSERPYWFRKYINEIIRETEVSR